MLRFAHRTLSLLAHGVRRRWLAIGLLASLPVALSAQAPDTSARVLNVYLDCRTWGCDRDLFITEVRFASLTRDRADADVQLLVTGLGNGAGGRQLTLQFIGLRRFLGETDTVVTTLLPNTAEDATRREIIRVAKLGLVRFALRTSVASGLRVDDGAVPAAQREVELRAHDPWNFWVFSVGVSGGANAESRSSRGNAGTSLSARRVTDAWKISIGGSGNYRQSTYQLSDSTRSTYILRDFGARARIVRAEEAAANKQKGIAVPIEAAYNEPTIRAFLLRATAESALGRHKEAVMDYGNALVLDPKAADILILRGWAKYNAGDKKGAREDFEKAARFLPDDPSAIAGLRAVESTVSSGTK